MIKLFAWINDDGAICGWKTEDGAIQIAASCLTDVQSMRPLVEQLARETRSKMRLVQFILDDIVDHIDP